ncbi:hypothetical protein C6I20_01445 [Aeromicrobium sp. A1-2]|uniref:MlaD family protein n=1 Tax=Aeromicrobium sp. A1-2 TaxID=2107713 RepID=UPI000E505D3E|nr:MlaD family protein [Aeromicrobium sp. A1-2]AXT83984.1 hypothetical protein C6I20_01445 [Aeromicrobium sp. A1-2]
MRRLSTAIVIASMIALVGGCGADLSDVPVPSKVSGPTYQIEAVFDSALNLPRQAPVKLDGRVVGDVVSVVAVDYTAHVTLRLTKDTRLPTGTRAEVRLTAPVGEAFVALDPPEDSSGIIVPGDVINIDLTGTAADTTDLLTNLSVAVTGGSYADLKVVVDELVTAMDGNSGSVRHLLGELDTLVTTTNSHRDDLDGALDAMDRLSAGLSDDAGSITTSVQQLTPAVERLAARQDAAMEMLAAMTRLGDRSSGVITELRVTLGQQLKDAGVVLDEVIHEQDRLAPLLTGITAFGDALDRATPGDFANFDLTAIGTLHVADGVDLPPDLSAPTATTMPTLPDLIGGLVPDVGDPNALLGSLLGNPTGGGSR